MQIVICDDNSIATAVLTQELTDHTEYNVVNVHTALQCIRYMEINSVDILFLSVCSDDIDYKSVMHFLREKVRKTVVFMIGSHYSQSVIAYQYRCDGFIERPYRKSDIGQCIDKAALLSKRIGRVAVRTFGRFDVFINGKLVDFHNAKAKELFALCVDRRGGAVSMEEAIDKLWSNRTYDDKVKKLYRKSVICIKSTFEKEGINDVFCNERGVCSIRTERIECDYYMLLQNPSRYGILFNGEYMFDYPWAVDTSAYIANRINDYGNMPSCMMYD